MASAWLRTIRVLPIQAKGTVANTMIPNFVTVRGIVAEPGVVLEPERHVVDAACGMQQ